MTQAPAPELLFLRRDPGQRLCVHHAPAASAPGAPVRAAVVYVQPLGEEMNKSRRMAAMQARALAAAGCAVLQIDLLGCGDSTGLLSDATWPAWGADVQAACDWLTARHPGAPLCLWGLRGGALLAAEVAARQPRPTPLLLWQPLLAGKTLVQQLLRLKAAASLSDGAAAKAAMAALREALARGETVDVAGYPWPAALVQSLEAALLATPRAGSPVAWLEVSTRADASLSPASTKLLDGWRAAGVLVQAGLVAGPTFWQSTEIEDAPALLPATLQALDGLLQPQPAPTEAVA